MRSSHKQFLWVVEFYNRQQISEFWRNCWKSSWPPANEMQGAWFKSCAGVAFPSIPEWAWFSPCQETRVKGKKPCNIDLKIPMKIWFHCPPTFLSSNPKILKAFLKPFPTKIKSTKWPVKEKKRQGIATIKRGGENTGECGYRQPTLTTFFLVLNKIIDKIAQFASIMQFLVK